MQECKRIIINLIRRLKIGADYKNLQNKTYYDYVRRSDNNLITGAKIIYKAQSTFHTLN